MARYRKIETSTMCDERVRRLSRPQPNGQSVWQYLLIGQRTIAIPGVVVAREAVAADDLGWSVEGFREAFGEVFREGLAKANWEAGLVVLPKALLDRHGKPRDVNRPQSPNVVRGWAKLWPEIPECALKDELHRMLAAFCEALGASFAKAFREAFAHPSPIQDQEQDQEQEREKPSPRTDVGSPDPDDRRAAGDSVWARHRALRERLHAELNLPGKLQPLHDFDPGRAELAARILERPDPAVALEACEHVLAVGEAEARAKGTLQWLDGGIWRLDRFSRMLAMSPADARRMPQRPGAKPGIPAGPPRLKTFVPAPPPDPATLVSAEEMREAFAAARRSG